MLGKNMLGATWVLLLQYSAYVLCGSSYATRT